MKILQLNRLNEPAIYRRANKRGLRNKLTPLKVAALLAASLLAIPKQAKATWYAEWNMSGNSKGTFHTTPDSPAEYHYESDESWQEAPDSGPMGGTNYALYYMPVYYSLPSSQTFDVSGSMTPTLHWDGDENNLPPTRVILALQVSAIVGFAEQKPEGATFGSSVEGGQTTVSGTTSSSVWRTLLVIDNPERKSTLPLPSKLASVQVNVPNVRQATPEGEQRLMTLNMIYLIDEVSFSLQVRRKVAVGVAENSFDVQASIAAGAVETPEHKADVRAVISPKIVGLKLPFVPKVIGGDGNEGTNATFAADADGVTDINGAAKLGTLLSGNRATPTDTPIILELPVYPENNPQASVSTHWDDVHDWTVNAFSGADGGTLLPGRFAYAPGITSLSFRPKFGGVPISGHQMKFTGTDVMSLVWDEGLESYTYSTGTVGEDEDPGHAEGQGPLLTFSPSTATGGSVYMTTLRVPYDARRLVLSAKPWAVDQNVVLDDE